MKNHLLHLNFLYFPESPYKSYVVIKFSIDHFMKSLLKEVYII